MQTAILELQPIVTDYDEAGVGPIAARARGRIAAGELTSVLRRYRGLFTVICVARYNAAFRIEDAALVAEVPHPLTRSRTIMGDRNSRSKRIYEQLTASVRWLVGDAAAHEVRHLAQIYIDVFAEVVDGRELVPLQPFSSG